MLEKLRNCGPLTARKKQIHDQGLVTVLRQIHDALDESVLGAYEAVPLDWSVSSNGVSGALGDFPPLFDEGGEVVSGRGFAAEAGGFDVGDLLG